MDSPEEGARPEAPARRARAVPVLVGLLVFALAAAGAFATLWLTKDDDVTAADVESFLGGREPDVVERVSQVIDLLFNYDATNIDEVSDQLLEISGGDFSEDYEDLVGGGNLEKALRDASASSRGQIVSGPDVFFRDPAEAVALATVSQTAQSRSNPTGTTTDYVVRIILVLADGDWKAQDVEILSTDQG